MVGIKKYSSNSANDTHKLGLELAQSFSGGEVVALYGELGSGKTALTQGIAAGLGVKEKVNSPTFNIMKLYQAKGSRVKQLVHIDAYRLEDTKDLVNIGVYDLIRKADILTIIEWAERVEDLFAKGDLIIRIKGDGAKRNITVEKK